MFTIFLHGDFVSEGKFFAQIAEVFTITLSANTLSADLGTGGASGTMGTFEVTLTDTMTTPAGTNDVYMYSIITGPDDNDQIQMVRVTNLDATQTIVPPRIDLTLYDDLNDDGTAATGGDRELKNNVLIRTRERTGGGTYTDEIHTITVDNSSFTGSLEGNYRTTIYFQLISN